MQWVSIFPGFFDLFAEDDATILASVCKEEEHWVWCTCRREERAGVSASFEEAVKAAEQALKEEDAQPGY